jgi:hypothetical protein
MELPYPLSLAGRLNILLHALLFVIGFSLVFVIGWGGATTLLGGLFGQYKQWIGRIGGLVLIVFGLATMDILRIPWFYMDTRPEYKGKTGTYRLAGDGLFFAAGWSLRGGHPGGDPDPGSPARVDRPVDGAVLGYSLGLVSHSCCWPWAWSGRWVWFAACAGTCVCSRSSAAC